MPNYPPNLGFLIDENLSPELADRAQARGFRSLAVARTISLRGRGDAFLARYALDYDFIVVTNNLVDFERIYIRNAYHPGLVFLCAEDTKLRKKMIQLVMMDMALDEIERDSLLQEALKLDARMDGDDMIVDLKRYFLPDLARD